MKMLNSNFIFLIYNKVNKWEIEIKYSVVISCFYLALNNVNKETWKIIYFNRFYPHNSLDFMEINSGLRKTET